MPATEIITPARQALLGGMVSWADDRRKFTQNYAESLAIMLSVCLPLSAGLALVSRPLVHVVLGEKWSEAAPLIAILVFSGLVRMFSETASAALIVLRQPRINTMTTSIMAIFYLCFLYYGVTFYGIVGAACGRAATSVISLMLNSIVLRRYLGTSLFPAFRLALRTIFATSVMVASLLAAGLGQSAAYGLDGLGGLLEAVASGAGVFVLVHVVLWAIFGRGEGIEARMVGLTVAFIGLPRRWMPS